MLSELPANQTDKSIEHSDGSPEYPENERRCPYEGINVLLAVSVRLDLVRAVITLRMVGLAEHAQVGEKFVSEPGIREMMDL